MKTFGKENLNFTDMMQVIFEKVEAMKRRLSEFLKAIFYWL